MNRHDTINSRSLRMARAIADKIDADPARSGLEHARAVCKKWQSRNPRACFAEWLAVLERPWNEIKSVLLDETERGNRLRQSDPFCGILTPQERWEFYRKTTHET